MADRAIRFRVCDLSRSKQAASWGIYVNARTSDVYVVPRNLGASIKISLHESGSWRFAYLGGFYAEKVRPLEGAPKTRLIDEWTRSSGFGAAWAPALKLITPSPSINSDLESGSRITNINTSAEGVAIEVQIHIAAEPFPLNGPLPKGLKGLSVLRSLALPSGEQVHVSCRKTSLPDYSSIPPTRVRRFHGDTGEPLPDRLRMLLLADDQDGVRCVHDLVNQE